VLKSIEEEWLGFAAMTMPGIAKNSVQYSEMKKAFFAGAWTVYCANVEISQPHVSSEQACEYLDSLEKECEAFKSQMMREYGERN